MSHARKIDISQPGIVEALRKHGAEVVNLSRVGFNVPDLLVAFRGRLHLIECKTGKSKLTAGQEGFREAMQRVGVEVVVLRSQDEAVAWAVEARQCP